MIRKYRCIKKFKNIEPNDIVTIEKKDNNYIINGEIEETRDTIYTHFEIVKLSGWKYSPYSHSKIETWVSCPKKFEFNYIIKPPKEDVPNPILEKGKLFHAILEYDIINKLDNFDFPDNFSALTKKDCENVITQALNFIETSDIYDWIKNIKGEKVSEQEIFIGPDLTPVDCLEDSLIRGFIDLIIWDKKTNSCYIFDWKTGGKSKEALKKWPKPKDQLELYAIWAYETYGATYIETAFVYVEHDHVAKYVFEEEDIKSLKKKLKVKINNIENDSEFNKSLTQLCAWCDFRELCLGLPLDKNPRDITKEEIFRAAKNTKKSISNSKNSLFLNKLREAHEIE